MASRSIAAVDESVTLPQFRALVAVEQLGGTCRVGDLGAELRIQPSTATRLCDRLVRAGLVTRAVDPASRRKVTVSLTGAARRLLDAVTAIRRREIAAIVAKLPTAQRSRIVDGLTAFRDAAGPDLSTPTVPW